jgi:hypothetical protein
MTCPKCGGNMRWFGMRSISGNRILKCMECEHLELAQ